MPHESTLVNTNVRGVSMLTLGATSSALPIVDGMSLSPMWFKSFVNESDINADFARSMALAILVAADTMMVIDSPLPNTHEQRVAR